MMEYFSTISTIVYYGIQTTSDHEIEINHDIRNLAFKIEQTSEIKSIFVAFDPI